jgi:competence protein ComEC
VIGLKRPLTALSAALLCGAWLGSAMPFGYFALTVFLLVCAVLCKSLLFRRTRGHMPFPLIFTAIVVFTAGLGSAQYVRYYNLSRAAPFAHRQVTVFGEVLGIEREETSSTALLYVYRLRCGGTEYEIGTKMNLVVYGDRFHAALRDLISAEGELQLYPPARFRGDYDARGRNAARGVFARIYQNDAEAEVIGSNKRTVDLLVWGANARDYVNRVMDRHLSGDEGALAKGILIGDKRDFSDALYDTFRKSGLLHITAVSGQHVAIFIIFIGFGARSVVTNRKRLARVLLGAIFAYTVVVGAQPSILRASLMAAFGILLENAKLRRDALTALMLSSALMAAYNPFFTRDVSFQLSFLATLGLILTRGKISRYNLANAGAAAFLYTSPLLAYSFNTVTFASLFTNILIAPLILTALVTGYVMCLVPFTAAALAPLLYRVNHVMLLISKLFAAIPHFTAAVPSPSGGAMVCWAAGLYAAYRVIVRGVKNLGTATSLAVSAALLLCNAVPAVIGMRDIRVNFIATDSGDGVQVRTPNGYNILVDAGKGTDVYAYLRSKNLGKIDTLLLTGLQRENVNGAVYLLNNTPIGAVCLPEGDGDAIAALAAEKGAEVKRLSPGDRLDIDGIRFDILQYDVAAKTKSDASAAVKMTCYRTGFLLLGGFGADGARELLAEQDGAIIKSDVLRLGDGGAAAANSKALISAAGASYAIANAGYNSKTRLSDEVHGNLSAAGTTVLKTYREGTISIAVNKNGIKSISKTRIPIEEDH